MPVGGKPQSNHSAANSTPRPPKPSRWTLQLLVVSSLRTASNLRHERLWSPVALQIGRRTLRLQWVPNHSQVKGCPSSRAGRPGGHRCPLLSDLQRPCPPRRSRREPSLAELLRPCVRHLVGRHPCRVTAEAHAAGETSPEVCRRPASHSADQRGWYLHVDAADNQ